MRNPAKSALRLASLCLVSALSLSCGGDSGSTGPSSNPTPTITAGSRDTVTATAAPFSEVLTGTDFVTGVVASVDGNARTTLRLHSTSIAVQLTPKDLSTPGDRQITAKNPEPGGGPSAPWVLHVLTPPPAPTMDSISPKVVALGGPQFTLHAYGTGFVRASKIRWNGADLPTTYESATELTTVIPSGWIAVLDSAQVLVFTPAPGGGVSAARNVTVQPPPPPPTVPTVTRITPDTVTIGPDTIQLTLAGAHFVGVDSVEYGDQGVTRYAIATVISDSLVTAPLDLSWLASLGVPQLRLRGPGGWGPYFYGLEVVNPVPVITALTPDTLDATKAADTVIVTGTGLVQGMALHDSYSLPMTTQWIDLSHLRVIVPQSTMLLGGSMAVQVDDSWDGGHSDSLNLYLRTPPPVVDSVTMQTGGFGGSDSVGSTGANFTVWGHGLAFSGYMMANGAPRITSHPSSTLVGFGIDGSFMTHPDTITFAYWNPAPGGGTSAAFPFIVRAPSPPPVIDSLTPLAARSDSGPQVITMRGHGFVPGTVVGPQPYAPDPSWFLQTTWPSTVLNDSTVDVDVPDSALLAGLTYSLQAQAPTPTTRPSNPVQLPIWTTGVRARDSVPSGGIRSMVVDTVHNKVYATRGDSVVALDPSSGAILDYLALPGRGDNLFLSDDGSELYVQVNGGNVICRVDLLSWTLSRTLQMGTWLAGPTEYPFLGGLIIPSRQDPMTFALVKGKQFYYLNMETWENQVWIIDDTVPRARIDTIGSYALDGRFDGDTIDLVTRTSMVRLDVDSGGPTTNSEVPHAFIGAQAAIVSPSRVAGDGFLFDLYTGATLANSSDLSGLVFGGRSTDRYFVTRFIPVSGGAVRYVLQVSAINTSDGSLRRTIGVPGFGPGSAASTTSGRLLVAGSPSYAGGDPPPYLISISSVLTDP